MDRRPMDVVSPHFECTRHNVWREWLKWRDLGESGHVLEWIRDGVAVPWLTRAPTPPFNQGVSCRGLPFDQATFLQDKIERLTLSGVLSLVEYSHWVSRAFLVPKSSGSGWRLVVNLRVINKVCRTRWMGIETLVSLRLIAKPSDHWVSFELKDGFHSLAIAPQAKEVFAINLDGKLLQFCALPMVWSLSRFVFEKLTKVFTDQLRDTES